MKKSRNHDPLILLKLIAEQFDLVGKELSVTITTRDECTHCSKKMKQNQEIFTLPFLKLRSSTIEKKIAAYFEKVKIRGVFYQRGFYIRSPMVNSSYSMSTLHRGI